MRIWFYNLYMVICKWFWKKIVGVTEGGPKSTFGVTFLFNYLLIWKLGWQREMGERHRKESYHIVAHYPSGPRSKPGAKHSIWVSHICAGTLMTWAITAAFLGAITGNWAATIWTGPWIWDASIPSSSHNAGLFKNLFIVVCADPHVFTIS